MSFEPAYPLAGRDIYTVSRLNREVHTVLEGSFPLIWLAGELSNLARPGSGHWYFTLKDEAAQVRAAMFRNRNQLVKFRPQDGMQVMVRARIGLYEARGEFQLVIEHMEVAGDGALRQAFEQLKQKLDQAGLFDLGHKQPLPSLPARIGVITSPSGAAIHDILTTLKRRFPGIPVIVYPVPVQGAGAGRDIARMIRLAGERNECDVLILARGGGSLEDLWAFNEEEVAHAIHACPIPVVSGIGHEVDVTIADLVADQRAPTPTGAAELVTPDQTEWRTRLEKLQQRLGRARQRQFDDYRQRLKWLANRLPHPARRIEERLQRLDELELRRNRATQHILRHRRAQLAMLQERLQQFSPRQRLDRNTLLLRELTQRARRALHYRLTQQRQHLGHLTHSLETVSPLATLSRGYAIVTIDSDDRVIRTATEVAPGDSINTRLYQGSLVSTVTRVHKK
ncbi:MAG: exodeoxyribonuclease VII large subunit [Proteobacteria bacterium]|jgi:exodeoxyribonuclease VII large subunit|nr:exodeoxyribonuclease VII large subunit [Pseudomonadota bacterium]